MFDEDVDNLDLGNGLGNQADQPDFAPPKMNGFGNNMTIDANQTIKLGGGIGDKSIRMGGQA